MQTKQDNLQINVSLRKPGKHFSRSMRTQRIVPAVVYGPKVENYNISLSEVDALRYSSHGYENSIFTLTSSDAKINGLKVLKKTTDIHPVSRRPVHMDFFAPDMTQEVRVHVELRFIGKPEGVKEGGVFSAIRRDIEVECLPTEIPEFFEVDVSHLQLDESLHVSDLKLPESIKLITSSKETIASVAEVSEEAESPTPAEGGTEATAAATPATEEKKS